MERSHKELGKMRLDPRQSGSGVCILSCCLYCFCPAPRTSYTEMPPHEYASKKERLSTEQPKSWRDTKNGSCCQRRARNRLLVNMGCVNE